MYTPKRIVKSYGTRLVIATAWLEPMTGYTLMCAVLSEIERALLGRDGYPDGPWVLTEEVLAPLRAVQVHMMRLMPDAGSCGAPGGAAHTGSRERMEATMESWIALTQLFRLILSKLNENLGQREEARIELVIVVPDRVASASPADRVLPFPVAGLSVSYLAMHQADHLV